MKSGWGNWDYLDYYEKEAQGLSYSSLQLLEERLW